MVTSAFPRASILSAVFIALAISPPAGVVAQEPGAPPPDAPDAIDESQWGEVLQCIRRGDFANAVTLLAEARVTDPSLGPPEVEIAKVFYTADSPRAVRYWLEQAVVRHPSDPEAYLLLADMALTEQRITEADMLYAKSRALAAGATDASRAARLSPNMFRGLAATASHRKDWLAAKQHFEAWLALAPRETIALQGLARVLFEVGDFATAEARLNAAKGLDPDMPTPSALLGEWHENAGRRAEAAKYMDAALAQASDDVDVLLRVARWRLRTDQIDEAEQTTSVAIELEPSSIEAQILHGEILLVQGRLAEAESRLQAALLTAPNNFGARNLLALTLCEQPDDAKKRRGLEYATANGRLYPNSHEAVATFGWALHRNGHTQEAEQLLRRITGTPWAGPNAIYYFAEALNANGRTEDAGTVLAVLLKSPRAFWKRDAAECLRSTIQGGSTPPAAPAPPLSSRPK